MMSSLRFQFHKCFAAGFMLLSIGFFVAYAVRNFDKIPALKWNIASFLVALTSVSLIVFGIGVVGFIWYLFLRDNGVVISWKQAQIIFSISQFGKYLPGNVGQHIGRIVMAREAGIPLSITLNTMVVEVLWGVGVAVGLALVPMLMSGAETIPGLQLSIGPIPLAAGTIVLLLLPWFGISLLNRYFPQLMSRFSGGRVEPPRPLTALIAATLFLLCFFVIGLVIKLQAQWFFAVEEGSLFEFTGLFAMVWLAGYLTPGAPGGFGVREAMMVLLLSPVLGAGAAVGLGVTLRVTTTIGDAVAFSLGLVGNKIIGK